MKKALALLLVACMVLSLAACGKSGADDPIELTMWCIATEADSNHQAYVNAIAAFETAHPEIKFTWEATENEAYKTKIKSSMQANELPDIFFTWGLGFLKDFVDAKKVYCLDDTYKDYASELGEGMLANHKFDGKLYAAPLTFNIVSIFANMDLLAKVGYTAIPTDYADFIACCDKLVAAGIYPFTCSNEPWTISEYIEPLVQKTIGTDALTAMYKGEKSWDDAGFISAIEELQNMVKKGYFDPTGAALNNDTVKANFINGSSAFYINGSWNIGDIVKGGLEDKVQVMEYPVVNSANASMGEIVGGPNDSLAVAANSKHAKEAAKAVFELTKGICKEGYLLGTGLPAWAVNYDTSALNKLSVQVGNIVNNSKKTVLFGDNFMEANATAIYLDYLVQAYNLKIDAKACAAGLEKDMP